MKKILAIILVLFAIVGCIACSSTTYPVETKPELVQAKIDKIWLGVTDSSVNCFIAVSLEDYVGTIPITEEQYALWDVGNIVTISITTTDAFLFYKIALLCLCIY